MPRYRTVVLDEEQAEKLASVLQQTVQLCNDLSNIATYSSVDEAQLHDEAKKLLEDLDLSFE